MTKDLASAVFARIPKIARAVQASNPDIKGLNILSNNGELAYQSVFHSHIHLIPRYTKEDGFGLKMGTNKSKFRSISRNRAINSRTNGGIINE